MKKLTIIASILIFSIVAIIFIPIIYDYFTTRSYGSEPFEIEEQDTREIAIFASGCFWCLEEPFEKIEGVDDAIPGYIGGQEANPSYEEVAAGETGHVEAVQVLYDPNLVAYEDLLQVFWRQIDPTDDEGQFVDRGHQYRTAIYYNNNHQQELAEISKQQLEKSERFEKNIVTPIKQATTFYRAEDYHQNFYQENSVRYEFYWTNSGREEFFDEFWGEDWEYTVTPPGNSDIPFWRLYKMEPEEELENRLTELQFSVTQESETEEAYENEYWDHDEDGIYVDIVSREPLFSSTHQYDSETGWPSFTEPVLQENIVENNDWGLLMRRKELRSHYGDSHLGYVYNDGPEPTGIRYTVNSAALDFIAKVDMEQEGYEEFLYLFED